MKVFQSFGQKQNVFWPKSEKIINIFKLFFCKPRFWKKKIHL